MILLGARRGVFFYMIQDIYPLKLHNEYFPRSPRRGDYLLAFAGNQIIVKPDETFFRFEDLPTYRSFIYLFEINSTGFFLIDEPEEAHVSMNIRLLRSYQPQYLGFAGITAWQLYGWMNDNQYCGRCSYPMIRDKKERAMRCERCGNIVYPKISPAVIVAVINDKDQILVTKFANSTYKHYALISGFTEIGETIEETVIREVKEEAGLDVEHLHYYKSQPWSFSSTLLFGFFCRVRGSDEITMDETELKVARWADRTEEIDSMDNVSLTSEMIQYYKKGLISFNEL